MMASSNGNIFHVIDPLWGNPPTTGGLPPQSQWRGTLMFSLICTWTNVWANTRDIGDLRRHHTHYVLFYFFNIADMRRQLSLHLWYKQLSVYHSEYMMTSWYGNAFCITGPLWWKSTINFSQKRSAKWDFDGLVCSQSEQALKQTVDLLLILDAIMFTCRHCNVDFLNNELRDVCKRVW